MVDVSNPFNTCSKIILNCGNIACWNKIKKKVLLTSTQELSSSLENTLVSSTGIITPSITDDVCLLRNSALYQEIKPDERNNLNITLKIFLTEWNGSHVSEAINTSLAELCLSSVDTVILAFPPCPVEELTLDRMKPVWQAMEKAADNGQMKYLGTSDLNMRCLKLLFEWATVKPRINQMNLAQCCTIPEDLVEYARDINIRLFTHNDNKTILPNEDLQKTLVCSLKTSNGSPTSWQNGWVTRYHAIINMRGIVSHKGYIVELENIY